MGTRRQRIFSLISACVALISITACAPIEKEGADGVQGAQVEDVVRQIIAADMAGDLDGVMALYSDDAILLSPGGPDIAGIDAIREHYGKLFAETELTIENQIHETIVSGKLAMTRGVNRVTATPKAGGPARSGSDKYMMALEQDAAGNWRISHLIWAPQPD